MSTFMGFKTPGLPIYEVFPGAGMIPTILVTSEPLSDVIQWQFVGKAPAHMPMHQVVYSLQRQLVERPGQTPQMVSRWHGFLLGVLKRKVAMCQRTWTKEQNWSPLVRQLHTSCYMLSWCWVTLISAPPSDQSPRDQVPRWNRFRTSSKWKTVVSGSWFPQSFLEKMMGHFPLR